MTEIGAALREARSRARLEIAQIESQTKIRAKYLRALENEEWELLPGPTYVKSFLKTYADLLGLDGRAVVAEYKAAHEPVEELLGVAPRPTAGRMAPQTGPRPLTLVTAVLVLVAAAIGIGYLLTGDGSDEPAAPQPVATTAPAADRDGAGESDEPVTVTVEATGELFVCARAGDRQLIAGRNYQEGQRTGRLRGRRILITLSSDDAIVRVGGNRTPLPQVDGDTHTFAVDSSGITVSDPATTACGR